MTLETVSLVTIKNEDYEIASKCNLTVLHVKIKNMQKRVADLVDTIRNTSWIKELTPEYIQDSYKARAERTIKDLVDNVLKCVNDEVTSDLGEYLVSMSTQEALCNELNHIFIPLAELWKEKLKGNPGFDFHTQTTSEFIAFGEAKYNSNQNPYTDAIEQIERLINEGNDRMDLSDLDRMPAVSKTALLRVSMSSRAFSIAFSISAKNPKIVFDNVINKLKETTLLNHPEIYVIGVEL